MLFKAKLKASAIHLVLSLFIFFAFIFTLRSFWFPEPYFTAAGGWQGLKIVAFIDIVLGPLLTFVVFNLSKPIKELKIDLSVIFILQISALIWGANTVYNQRPIAITFWESRFYTVPYNVISKQYSSSETLNLLAKNPRQFYFVPKPHTIETITKLNDEVIGKQLPPYQLIERYEPIKNHFQSISKFSINIKEIILKNENMRMELMSLLNPLDLKIIDNIYIPLISRYQNIILIFNKKGQLLGNIKAPLKPSN